MSNPTLQKHPRFGEYVHQHTKDWSATVARGDAYKEWAGKAVGFVSYGGVAAGTRAVQMLKPVLGALRMVALNDAVHIPFVSQFLDSERKLQPNDVMENAATTVLNELVTWSAALRAVRPPAAPAS
jgi:NAD(P)H-dependent FMN reductase